MMKDGGSNPSVDQVVHGVWRAYGPDGGHISSLSSVVFSNWGYSMTSFYFFIFNIPTHDVHAVFTLGFCIYRSMTDWKKKVICHFEK